MNIERLINDLKEDKDFADCFVVHHIEKAQEAEWEDLPHHLHESVRRALEQSGIELIYSHQKLAYKAVMEGRNIVISTGVASGKSLCYHLPILQTLQTFPKVRGLFLFPTKALAQDQQGKLSGLLRLVYGSGSADANPYFEPRTSNFAFPKCGIYDGDTPTEQRKSIRSNANFVFSNPDMLSMGILPHHSQWAEFFRNLKFVIIDEVHMYRGVFGSHFANVLRRLKRVAQFYGAKPQFILTSATLSNAREFISMLLEEDFDLIDHDGSPQGARHFLLYNPPFVNKDLGIRRSVIMETVRVTETIFPYGFQTLVFAQARKAIELILTYLQNAVGDKDKVQGYRSGYLPTDRRAIEKGFREGRISTVVSTNALELGIDIGNLDTVVLCSYPGTIAATRQQAGRAGRKAEASAAFMIASASLIDQYILQHPDFLFAGSPEMALLNPNNPFILMQHLQCALFEKPFTGNEAFGSLPQESLKEYLEFLQEMGKAYESNDQYFWKSEEYPADEISLRNAGLDRFNLIVDGNVIGEVDDKSVYWLVHPEAVYLQDGESYLVESVDTKTHTVQMKPFSEGFYTQPMSTTEIDLIEEVKSAHVQGGSIHYGKLLVTNQVTGYKKLKWYSHEVLGYGELDLPKTELITYGYWFTVDDNVVHLLEKSNQWRNNPNDYGPKWKEISLAVRTRDNFECQNCHIPEEGRPHDVHHKIPFRKFINREEANALPNLTTLCPSCHKLAEQQAHIQSGMAGLSYILGNLAPLYLMCDIKDIGVMGSSSASVAKGKPAVILYDQIPGGIGLSEKMYEIHDMVMQEARHVIQSCQCRDGCPACTGPVADNGEGAKEETLAMLELVI
ncbi:MAG TPA: DEAD/DEAH box helicase [Candidatus Cloacimonadota bacterium]|nr:DEAD/DEAH box helicase [Candidatus Cloacimonadota bacterium]HPT71629.1 DEAD/DEAH box helicase [Candidatus Cloacimonadota bacterium]